ncbi:MAG: TAXI family TRAP transporter solute-binding subunit [Granulosicoccus sp.]
MANKRNPRWRRNLKEGSLVYGVGALLVAAAFWVTFQFVEPAPPRSLTIATGSPEGAYWRFAKKLQMQLAEHDVELELISTDGSVENLDKLANAQVDVAFLQSGLASADDYPSLQSLGALYNEPLWIFIKDRPNPIERITELTGLKIAIGGVGSGTRLVAEHLLALNRLDDTQLDISELSGSVAAQALIAGEIDVLMSVSSIQTPIIQQLLQQPDVGLVSLDRARAYSRRTQWITELELPEGIIDLNRNTPDRDMRLLAVNATLAGTDDLHPALRDLLLQAVDTVFSESSILSPLDTFPKADGGDFAVAAATRRYYEQGPPLLQRYLPFWIANLIDRLKLLALPLFALMLPLSKVLPPAYKWTVRKKIYRWYDEVQEIDQTAGDEPSMQKLSEYYQRLLRIEENVREIEVPLSYAHELYSLRLHLDLLQGKIGKRLKDNQIALPL